MTKLDDLIARAKRAEPDELSEPNIAWLASEAAIAGRGRDRRRTRIALAASVMALAAGVFIAIGLSTFHSTQPQIAARRSPGADSTSGAPVEERDLLAAYREIVLATGDRVVGTPTTRYRVERVVGQSRRVRLEAGAMMFDVRSLANGRFEVVTDRGTFVALGTVFTIDVTHDVTTLRVYEGRVETRADDLVRVVAADETITLGTGPPVSDPLESEAIAAREVRAEAARVEIAALRQEEGRVRSLRAPSITHEHDSPPGEPRATTTASPEATAAPAPPGTPEQPATPEDARRAIREGRAADALALARTAIADARTDPWTLVEADALRALGRTEAAADAYARARSVCAFPRSTQAAYLEARLRLDDLHDAGAALRVITSSDVTSAESPLRERGMALEIRALTALGRTADVRAAARRYIETFPNGSDARAIGAMAN